MASGTIASGPLDLRAGAHGASSDPRQLHPGYTFPLCPIITAWTARSSSLFPDSHRVITSVVTRVHLTLSAQGLREASAAWGSGR